METRWEYSIVPLQTGSREMEMKQLNNYGHAGWELVQIRAGVAYFKKPIPKPHPGIADVVTQIGREMTAKSQQGR